MPGKIKIRIICARNLPIMDRSSDSSDAFVEVRFGANHFDKTHVHKKSLDPEWNSRFVFEVEEDEIQEEPLLIRVLDHDTYSSHDAIGKVYIDLKPLLNENGPKSISGFLPIYDTLHGMRGEIKVQAKVEIINDCNEYRKSSCGVQFFCSSKVPEGYQLQNFCGFVEELLINDDPEYQWIDKIRTPRTSNEARQKLFTKLSGEVQRRIGLKCLEMNANCVLGYQQNFDVEGEHGIVVRGIGTAAYIYKPTINSSTPPTNASIKLNISPPALNGVQSAKPNVNTYNSSSGQTIVSSSSNCKDENETKKNLTQNSITLNVSNHPSTTIGISMTNTSTNPTSTNILKMNKLSPNKFLPRIHSDTDIINFHQTTVYSGLVMSNQAPYLHQHSAPTNTNELPSKQSILEKMEYPFFTIQQYPTGFIKSLCGIVCSRSVKLLGTGSSSDEIESRDKWWAEIRNEIRSHMKSLNCHVVIGYSETESICEGVCILSALGTAAIVEEIFLINTSLLNTTNDIFQPVDFYLNKSAKNCKLCHVPYSENDLPFPVALSNCATCGLALVPDVLFTSIQPLNEIETIGKGCLIRAIVSRPRKKSSNELSAKIISDNLPFIEYELHRQLLGKLKLKGMNMLYGLKVHISIGENLLVGMAEATACYAASLPVPLIPKILSEREEKTNMEINEIEKLRKLLQDEMSKNKKFFNLELNNPHQNNNTTNNNNKNFSNQPNATTITNDVDSSSIVAPLNESKALFKIELDDVQEKESVYLLLDHGLTDRKGFYTCNTEFMPGIDKFLTNVQMFTSVYRCETSSIVQVNQIKLNEICEDILESLKYKFRKNSQFCLTNLSFDSSLYDDDHAMIIVSGCCLTFDEHHDDDHHSASNRLDNGNGKSSAFVEDKPIEITNLSYVPNAQIENYLGFLNLFLIRESTQIKENGGLTGFMHCFISEVLALCRAHVMSLGGNALVSFRLNQCILLNNPHRNQGQCLINVSGDAVNVVKNK